MAAKRRVQRNQSPAQSWANRKAREQSKLEAARLRSVFAGSPRRLLTEFDVAAATGLAVATLRRWRWQQTGPPWMKLGATVRYDPRALGDWLCSRRAGEAR
jgi:predicted DNA-binding transcriptional regulator AlpA